MTKSDADIVASVRMYPTEAGGRKGPSAPSLFRCLFEFLGHSYDCVLVLDRSGPLSPGSSAVVPVKFLEPGLVKSRLRVGDKFFLRELNRVGEGVITEVAGEAG